MLSMITFLHYAVHTLTPNIIVEQGTVFPSNITQASSEIITYTCTLLHVSAQDIIMYINTNTQKEGNW
jgi:hypothetical protein